MKKRQLDKKEQNQLQRLQRENEKLKRTIASLRKQLSRLDIDQYQNLKEIIESQEVFETNLNKQEELNKLKKKWECHGCGRDYLKLIIVPRLDGVRYFRRCTTCGNRTKMKKYTEDVEGLVDE